MVLEARAEVGSLQEALLCASHCRPFFFCMSVPTPPLLRQELASVQQRLAAAELDATHDRQERSYEQAYHASEATVAALLEEVAEIRKLRLSLYVKLA